MRNFSLTALIASSILCAATTVHADAQSARLRAILEKVREHGVYYVPDERYPGRVMLEDPAKPEETPDHTVHIAGVYGVPLNDRLLAQIASLESRHWTLQPGGNWKMEQWQFRIELWNGIERVIHRERIENHDHTNILQSRDEDVSLNGPRRRTVLSIYNGLLRHWDAWQPAP